MRTFKHFLDIEEEYTPTQVDRSAFIYLPPRSPDNKFAQCETCRLFLPGKNRCGILGEQFKVKASASCGLYVHGTPTNDQVITNSVTPEEAGYVNDQVRCENCRSFDPKKSTCNLYASMNEALPDTFNLEVRVDKNGCCNAWKK